MRLSIKGRYQVIFTHDLANEFRVAMRLVINITVEIGEKYELAVSIRVHDTINVADCITIKGCNSILISLQVFCIEKRHICIHNKNFSGLSVQFHYCNSLMGEIYQWSQTF